MSDDSPDGTVTAAALALLSPRLAPAPHNVTLSSVSAASPGLQHFLQDAAADAEQDQTGRAPVRRASLQHRQRKGRKVTRACDTCKTRKARCSGTIPCDRCTRKGNQADCHYDAQYRRGRPVEPVRVSVAAVASHVDGGDRKRRKKGDRETRGSSVEVATAGLRNDDDNNMHACAVMSPPPEQPDPRNSDHRHAPLSRTETAAPSRASPELDVAEIQGQYYDTTSGLAFLHRALRRFSKHDRHDGEDATTSSANTTSAKPSRNLHNTTASSSTVVQSHESDPAATSEDSPTFTAGDRPLEPPQAPISHLDLPSLPRTLDLVNLYFESSIATFRIIHLPTVRHWVTTLLSNSTSNIPLHSNIGKAKASIVLLILAIATAHEDRSNGTFVRDEAASMRRSDGFFSAASALLEQETAGPTLASAQARIVQVLYLLITSRMNQAWYVFGTVVQLISALGLHRKVRHRANRANTDNYSSTLGQNAQRTDRNRNRDNNNHNNTTTAVDSRTKVGTVETGGENDYIHLQLRRRTFWTAYIVDKYLGVMFGRPAHYNDDDIDQEMPASVNDEDMTPSGPHVSSLPSSTASKPSPIVGIDKDCHMSALIHHARLARIVSEATRSVYSIRPSIGPRERIEAAARLNEELRKWQEDLPPYLGGAVRPSSLIPVFRRQAVALQINFSHARLHINRLFLLGSLGSANGAREGPVGNGGGGGAGSKDEEDEAKQHHVQEAILAAHQVLETVDQMVTEQGDTNSSLFHALWWTQYVTFCALATIYAWELQARRFRLPLYDNDDEGGGDSRRRLMELADRCIGHLARATASNSPSRRYAIILDKMRREVKRQQRREDGRGCDGRTSTVADGVRKGASKRTAAAENSRVADSREGDGVERNDFYPTNNDAGGGDGHGHGVGSGTSPWEELTYRVGPNSHANGDFAHHGHSVRAHDVGFGFMPGSTLGGGFGHDTTTLGASPSTGYGSSLDGMNWSVQEWQTEDWLNLDAIAFSSFLDA